MMTTPSSRARRPAKPAPRRLRDSAAALTAAGLLTAAALTASATAPAATAAAITARSTPIAWHACPADPSLDCATYPVPLDYAHPADGTVDLTLYRHPATDPAHRIGALFVNPGGPGDSTFKMTAKLVAAFYPGLAARFDILGMDPRGVGASTPIQCFPTDADREQALAAFVAVPLTPAETSADARADRAFTRACAANAGQLLAHMSTADVARDLDTLRQALGERQLTYLGQSYGTLLGATYANLFPGRVRAMVLDGMVDPAARTSDSLAYEKQRAAGFESMLGAFLHTCQQAGARCAFSAGNPAEKLGILRARVWQGPLALPDATTMDASRLWNWLSEGLPDPANWPSVAAYLQQVYQAATTSPAQAPADGTARPTGSGQSQAYSYNSADAFSAINCADEQLPRTPADWPQIATRFARAAPTFGRGQAYSALPCATWPATTTDRYAGPWNRPTAHPLLIVANLHDPATPYQMAIRASHELANARLLTIDGFGHTSPGESTCATQDVTTYLTTGQLPPRGTVCQPDTQPFH
jgi:pimeloyl-ACP methyl ester carboxylesterase